ncbi:uncharacterized protein LDX57_002489 [Aspergillus melleus]|uniref:uncharacterized protein n=1 Tax=Aspergillus melleus TaxID=138277 RepID=UPI001E8DF580|nr:uncharacterized protein LDX57_002489 [Aspergillus melleus]KAH8424746.1 hypothetical protein LDX57_002489 [Aspergillus melleus]
MADHTITRPESGDAGANLHDLADDALTQNGRVVHGPPGLWLQAAIHRIDGHSVVLTRIAFSSGV